MSDDFFFKSHPQKQTETKQQTNIFLSEGSGNMVSCLSNERPPLQFIYCIHVVYDATVLSGRFNLTYRPKIYHL